MATPRVHIPLIARIAWTALMLGLAARPVAAAPRVSQPVRLDSLEAPCQSIVIAATGPERLAVGWTIPEGPAAGVYLRQRSDRAFGPVRRVLGQWGQAAPRDLVLALDARGVLHAVWTALDAQGGRRLFYARAAGSPAAPVFAQPLAVAPQEGGAAGQADFPALRADAQGRMVLVWQESRSLFPRVRAARIEADGAARDLGLVSGALFHGMAPQILTVQPLRVAWYQIDEIGGRLRVDRWLEDQGRWEPDAMERQAARFAGSSQVLLKARQDGLWGAWPEAVAGGRATLRVRQAPEEASQTGAELVFARPAGEHRAPSLSGGEWGRLTLVWQAALANGRRAICLERVMGVSPAAPPLILSPPGQRFAAAPDHVTRDAWSAAVWTDDARDGGDGGVYFSEIDW
jgi:hypothetical protein